MSIYNQKKILNKLLTSKKTIIVAEMSSNHCQSLNKALKIVDEAKKAGADMLKLQTFKPESLSLKQIGNNQSFKKVKKWKKYKNRYELFNKAFLPWEWHKKIFMRAKKNNLPIFSSPFDLEAVDFLQKLKCPAYKIASPEITDIPLIEKVAKTKKPIILSLGLAEKKDIDLAVKTLRKFKCKKFILLKCLAHYPAKPELLNLNSISLLKKRYNCEVGFSDHTIDSASAITSVVLGAKMIEKHFKLENEKKSLDSFFSLGTSEFKKMVKDIRIAEAAMGLKTFKIDKNTKLGLKGRKSIFVRKKIKKNQILNYNNLTIVRPFDGLHPKFYKKVIGKKAKKNLVYGKPLKLTDIN
jgi:N-acetylneuraminate synthase/pseudaminic acid synthase